MERAGSIAAEGSQPTGVVVLGGSAGSVHVMEGIVAALPDDFSAALVVVVHLPEWSDSHLASILARATGLRVTGVTEGEALTRGSVHVARPGWHVLVDTERLRLTKGPRENGHRPSIDLCLRTAAGTWGSRSAGVIVSGALSDGAAGLTEVRAAGGHAIVQDPAEALFASMPESALARTQVDEVLRASDIPAALGAIARSWSKEVMGVGTRSGELPPSGPVPPSDAYGCPECGGALTPLPNGEGWICRVGHRFSAEALDTAQQEAVEAALWSALRALRENQHLNARLEQRAEAQAAPSAAVRFHQRAENARREADTLARLLGASEEPAARPPEPQLAEAGRS